MTEPTKPHAPTPSPPTGERKPLQTFAVHAVFLTLLLWVLPSLDAVYAYGFKQAGSALFGTLGADLRLEYHWVPPNQREDSGEIEMLGYRRDAATPLWESAYSVRDRGYQPTALLVALILATPATRRRHVVASVAGALTLNAFYLAQTGVLAATLFASVEPASVWLGDTLAAQRGVVEAMFGSPLVRYAAVFAVWAVASAPARRLDFDAVARRLGAIAPGARRA